LSFQAVTIGLGLVSLMSRPSRLATGEELPEQSGFYERHLMNQSIAMRDGAVFPSCHGGGADIKLALCLA
jgi:hypothetical protein